MHERDDRQAGGRSEPGLAGASARAEYERRSACDAARRRAKFGRLAPVVQLLAGPRPTTEAWGRGAEGEELVGRRIESVIGSDGVALHDRRIPGHRGNLDHLVVAATGVWVIDAKHYHGRLARKQAGGWFAPRAVLTIARRDESRLIAAARRQRATVEAVLDPDIPTRAVLCFTGVDLPLLARPFVIDDVLVTWLAALARTLCAPGPLGPTQRGAVADRLAHAFPPYRR